MSTTPQAIRPDGRLRQSRRDDQIRRKIEAEIGRRRSKVAIHARSTQGKQPHPKGSVMALKPLLPLTMPQDTLVRDAAQYMSAHRANCALVLDGDGAVGGIFTAKDMAFKVVGSASGDTKRQLTVRDIMTPSPTCVDVNASATDALNLMVSRGFRHLPVMDSDGDIAGVLDITRCYFEAMQKLERAYESSRKLHDALQGVQAELGASQPAQLMSYVQALRQHTAGPDLASVLDGRPPVYVDVRTSVAEAAALMRENRTTAVLVTDKTNIAGIFTSKDVVLRVLAAGIEPSRCSVVRVMTPQPDSAPMSMSIQDALHKMHDGHYLNLPVMNTENHIVGIVDVLRLTYAILEQINSMNGDDGPAWNRFWMSLDDDTDSVTSTGDDAPSTTADQVSETELAEFSIPDPGMSDNTIPDFPMDFVVQPEDSASNYYTKEEPFTLSFKFKAPNGRAHRINVTEATALAQFRDVISAKLSPAELETLGGSGNLDQDGAHVASGFAVSYLDDDGDLISVTTKEDIAEAVSIARRNHRTKSDIFLHHPDKTPEVELPKSLEIGDLAMPLILGGGAIVLLSLFVLRR